MVVLVPEALTDRGGTARLAKQLSATASSNFGSTRSSAYLVGTPPGVSGSICRTKVGVDATFVQCGKYRKRTMHGELIRWETSFRAGLLPHQTIFSSHWRWPRPPIIDKVEGRGGELRDLVRARSMHSDCGHLFAKAVRGSDHRAVTPPQPCLLRQ